MRVLNGGSPDGIKIPYIFATNVGPREPFLSSMSLTYRSRVAARPSKNAVRT